MNTTQTATHKLTIADVTAGLVIYTTSAPGTTGQVSVYTGPKLTHPNVQAKTVTTVERIRSQYHVTFTDGTFFLVSSGSKVRVAE